MTSGKLILVGLGIGALAAAAVIWWQDSSQYSAAKAQLAQAAIERLKAKRRVVEGTGAGSLTIESAGTDRGAVLIAVTRAGEEQSVKCRATVSPDTSLFSFSDLSTEVDCTPPGANVEPVRQLGAKAMEIIVREHVAATIEEREYDIAGTSSELITFLVVNRPAMNKIMRDSVDEAARRSVNMGRSGDD
jgi:hypothetical protein